MPEKLCIEWRKGNQPAHVPILQRMHAAGIERHAIRANKYHAAAIQAHIAGLMLTDKPAVILPVWLQGGWNGFIADDTIGQRVVDGHAVPVQAHGILAHQQNHTLVKVQQCDIAAPGQREVFLLVNNGIHETNNPD